MVLNEDQIQEVLSQAYDLMKDEIGPVLARTNPTFDAAVIALVMMAGRAMAMRKLPLDSAISNVSYLVELAYSEVANVHEESDSVH